MSPLEKRLSKLERKDVVADPLIIFITALEPGQDGPVDMRLEPVGLSAQHSGSEPLIRRLPGESVDAMIDRAQREHPRVAVWVARYDRNDDKPATPSTPTIKE